MSVIRGIHGTSLSGVVVPEAVRVASAHCCCEGGCCLVPELWILAFKAGVHAISMGPTIFASGASPFAGRVTSSSTSIVASLTIVASSVSAATVPVVMVVDGLLCVDLSLEELHLLHHCLELVGEGGGRGID
jgi:hypothetical protein